MSARIEICKELEAELGIPAYYAVPGPSASAPYAYMTVLSDTPLHTLAGTESTWRMVIQIDIVAGTYAAARSYADLAIAAMHGYQSTAVQSVRLERDYDVIEAPDPGQALGLWHIAQDYAVWYVR